jgi:hypothetical protein
MRTRFASFSVNEIDCLVLRRVECVQLEAGVTGLSKESEEVIAMARSFKLESAIVDATIMSTSAAPFPWS